MLRKAIRACVRAQAERRRFKRRLHGANPSLAHMERRSWAVLFLVLLGLLMHGTARADEEVVTYYLTDEMGSVLGTANAFGIVDRYVAFTPFGAPSSGVHDEQAPGFAGHVTDEPRGLVYMQSRYYDAHIGRFLSVDPVVGTPGQLADFNRYAYGRNNPHRYVDPDGRQVFGSAEVANGRYSRAGDEKAVLAAAELVVPGMGLATCAMNGCSASEIGLEVLSVVPVAKLSKLPKLVDAAHALQTSAKMAAAAKKGRHGEAVVRGRFDIGKQERIRVNNSDRIPDGFLPGRSISEVKNVSYQGLTRQIRDYVQYARDNNLRFNLYINENATLSKPLQAAVDNGDINLIRVSME